MKQFLPVFFLTAIIIGCDSNQSNQDDSILQSNDLIAYIENPSQKGSNGLLLGRIVILDISTKRKFYVGKEESYLNNPEWMNDCKRLVYISEAEPYDDSTYPLKFKISQDVIQFNLESRKNTLLFPKLEKADQKFYMLTSEVIGFRQDSYLIPQFNNVFQINDKDYKILKLLELDSSYYINDIDLSPDNNFLSLDVNDRKGHYMFLVYSLNDSTLTFSTNLALEGGGWDTKSENYLLFNARKIFNYNCINNLIDTLNIPVNRPSEIAYTKDGKIIGFAQKEEGHFKPDEIFIFNPKIKN